jgi:hypothetical protein
MSENQSGERRVWVSQPRATFGIVAKDGRVIDAPPNRAVEHPPR